MKFETFKGGRHFGMMEMEKLYHQKVNEIREHVEYEEAKAKLVVCEPKVAEIIIRIIEKECFSTGAKIGLIKKAIHAISAGEDLSKVESIEGIELASLKATFGQRFKTRDDLLGAFRKEDNKSGLEKYSTSQLKAELRRRKGK